MHPGVRDLVRQTRLHVSDLVLPVFVKTGGAAEPIASMPGHARLPLTSLPGLAAELRSLGIPAVLLFGIPDAKDAAGTDSLSRDGVVQRAVRALKDADPDLLVMTDVCFCEYTDHGHCGPLKVIGGRTDVDNDATLERLGEQAVSHAEAGADLLAPSGMMDGMIAEIRSSLDAEGFQHVPVMSYAAKYASAFYGPFRDAADSAPASGDRRGYQMDPANGSEALREVELDVAEGADMLMVKPALAYLDIISRVKAAHPGVPLAAYNVSGEYAMLKAAAANGWVDYERAMMEKLLCIRRAGADIILTYHAVEAAELLA